MIEFLVALCLILQVNVYQTVHNEYDIEYIKLTDSGNYAEAYNKDKELIDTFKILNIKENKK